MRGDAPTIFRQRGTPVPRSQLLTLESPGSIRILETRSCIASDAAQNQMSGALRSPRGAVPPLIRRRVLAEGLSKRHGHTLQATALVHEVWLRLVGDRGVDYIGRARFFTAAIEAMRRVLIARKKRLCGGVGGGDLCGSRAAWTSPTTKKSATRLASTT